MCLISRSLYVFYGTMQCNYWLLARDAIWEIEGLFDDLYERYARCDVENCCCVMGRNHQESQG